MLAAATVAAAVEAASSLHATVTARPASPHSLLALPSAAVAARGHARAASSASPGSSPRLSPATTVGSGAGWNRAASSSKRRADSLDITAGGAGGGTGSSRTATPSGAHARSPSVGPMKPPRPPLSSGASRPLSLALFGTAPPTPIAAPMPEPPVPSPPPKPIVLLRPEFLRARARWHAAFAAILAQFASVSMFPEKRGWIRSNFLFSRMSYEKQEEAASMLRRLKFAKGARIYTQGDYPAQVLFILSGSCGVSTSVPVPQLNRDELSRAQEVATTAAQAHIETHRSDKANPVAPLPRASTEKQLIDTHVQRILDGWYDETRDQSASITVELFHLQAPDCIGEKEALHRVSLRESTVVALTDVTVFAIRRVGFRHLIRGRLSKLLDRAVLLKDEIVRVRVAHALRMHYEKRAAFAPVRSRLSLTPFADRALGRMHQMNQLRAAIERPQEEEKQQQQAQPHSARPTPPAAPSPAARPASARRATTAVVAADSAAASAPPRFFPPKSPSQLAEYHRSLLLAQASLETERVKEVARRAEERRARRAAQKAGDQYKFGFMARRKQTREALKQSNAARNRTREQRVGGRRVWKDGVGWVHQNPLPSASATAADDSLGSSDSEASSGEDLLAKHVWHAFPHAYAEAQWHVYALDKKPVDPYAEHDAEQNAGAVDDAEVGGSANSLRALYAAEASKMAAALAKHDAQHLHLVVNRPSSAAPTRSPRGAGARPTSAPGGRAPLSSAAPSSPLPADLPLSASFAGLSTRGAKKGPIGARPASAAVQRAVQAPPRVAPSLNTTVFVSPPAAGESPVAAAASDEAASIPILVDHPQIALDEARSARGRGKRPGSASKASARGSPLLKFFSPALLRHLETHYMRSTDVDPISYTGQWAFFHAPVLRDQMPEKRRVRRPRNWVPFAIPDAKHAKALEKELQQEVLQCSPLGVAYIPPLAPAPIVRVAETQEPVVISSGGNANSEEHWRHLQGTTAALPQTPSATVTFLDADAAASASATPPRRASASASSLAASPRDSGANTPQRRGSSMHSPFRSSTSMASLQRSDGSSATGPLPLDSLLIPSPSASALASSSPARSPTSPSPAAPSSARRLRPASARQHRSHTRRPSLDALAKTYTFRHGHSDQDRLDASGKQAFANTDWQLAQIREGRVSTKLTAEEEAAVALLQSVSANGSSGAPGSQPSSGMASPQARSRHASRAASRRATATSRFSMTPATAAAVVAAVASPVAATQTTMTESQESVAAEASAVEASSSARADDVREEEHAEPQSSLHFLDLNELAKLQQQQQQQQESEADHSGSPPQQHQHLQQTSPPALADHLLRTAASLVQFEMASLFPDAPASFSSSAAHSFPHPPPAMPAARPSSAPRRRHLPPKPRAAAAAATSHAPSPSFSVRIIHKPLRPSSASVASAAVASGSAGLTRPTLGPSTREISDPFGAELDAAWDQAQNATRALVEKLSHEAQETQDDAAKARAMVQRLTAPVEKPKPKKRIIRPASAAPVVAVAAAPTAAVSAVAPVVTAPVVVVDVATPAASVVDQPLVEWDLDRPADAPQPTTEPLLSPSPPPPASAAAGATEPTASRAVPPIATHATLADLAADSTQSKPSTPVAFSARTPSPFAVVMTPPLRGSLSARLPVPAEEKQGTPEALYLSFDPRRRATQAVRKSLADAMVQSSSRPSSAAPSRLDVGATAPIAVSAAPPPASHPYPPTRAASISLSVAASHAYVYGSGNRAAGSASAAAMHFLASHTDAEPGSLAPPRGSLTARRPPTLSSASARAQSLLQQLQQFTVQKAKPRVIKAASEQRAWEDLGHYRER